MLYSAPLTLPPPPPPSHIILNIPKTNTRQSAVVRPSAVVRDNILQYYIIIGVRRSYPTEHNNY